MSRSLEGNKIRQNTHKVQYDFIKLDYDRCQKLLDRRCMIFTGIFCKPNNQIPLYFMPEIPNLSDLEPIDYNQIMQLILNRFIMTFQNQVVTLTRDKLSILIDRRNYGWNEVFKFLEGINRYSVYLERIILIGPSRFYGLFSMRSIPDNFANKLIQYSTIEKASKNEDYLNYALVPDVIGGSMAHNWVEYFQLEKEILSLYQKLLEIKNKFHPLKIEANRLLLSKTNDITSLKDFLRRVENVITKIKMDIIDPIDTIHMQTSTINVLNPSIATTNYHQFIQLMWLGGKAQDLRIKIMPLKHSIEDQCNELSSSNIRSDMLNQLLSAINAKNDTISAFDSNFPIEKTIEYIQFLISLRSDIKKFNQDFTDIKAKLSLTNNLKQSPEVKEVEMDIQNFKSNVNNFETNISSCLLLMSFDSNASSDDFKKLAKEVDNFLTTSNKDILDDISERLRSILMTIINRHSEEVEKLEVPIVS